MLLLQFLTYPSSGKSGARTYQNLDAYFNLEPGLREPGFGGMCFTMLMLSFAGVRTILDNPGFGGALILLTLVTHSSYVLFFVNAFCLPEYMMTIKRELLRLLESGKMFGREILLLEKRVVGIAPIGIKIGQFYKAERESTPLFLDFLPLMGFIHPCL
ncbi:unnamed protein product [Allacma fusca]|uniref:Uncharacterized protein n=1 Tax=Allacma fusca TaxID=39272 RepID=A0A8J2LAT7_9HEXA|nr:unnamed protein product [Allacma fusca]